MMDEDGSDDADFERRGDPFLVGVLDALEGEFDAGISLTFESGGTIFTGVTITAAAYYQAIGQRFAKAYEKQGHDGSGFISTFDQVAKMVSDSVGSKPRWYVHLRDVTAISGEQFVHFGYWRVDVNAINGFDFASPGDPDN